MTMLVCRNTNTNARAEDREGGAQRDKYTSEIYDEVNPDIDRMIDEGCPNVLY